MQLSQSTSGDVVRNRANGSFYRYETMADERCRIRPLELFPNGMLVPKTTDTIIDSDIEVDLIGTWSPGMAVSGCKGKSREVYEKEQRELRIKLVALEDQMSLMVGHMIGSHANRIKAVKSRLAALELGLQDLGTESMSVDMAALKVPSFKLRQIVVLPSGIRGAFLGLLPVNDVLLATVAVRAKTVVFLQVNPEALNADNVRHLSTV